MKIKAKCINDFRAPKRRGCGIQFGKVYTIISLTKERHKDHRVEVKEFPGVWYVPRRFQILDKEIILTLPDDLHNLPL